MEGGGDRSASPSFPQHSGHGWCRKAALATGLVGVFVSYVMGNFAIQLYSLAFKADLTTLALLQTIIMVPVNILQNTFSDRPRCIAQLRPDAHSR